jgi:ribose transport system ATP-binding protein
MGGADTNYLEITGLTKSFGPNVVLKDVSFKIGSGEFVGLMGPNGAGKSTLIKILAGVYSASSGNIRVGGEVIRSLADSSDVGFIHQDLGLVDGLTIAENLSLGAPPMKLLGPILNRRVERQNAKKILSQAGLNMHVDTMLGDLTAGEKTLVAVARVFDRGARILVLDETTSTLPPREASRVIASLTAVVEGGATVIMVTHKLSEILQAAQRVLVLVDGELVADEPTSGLDRAALVAMLRQHESTPLVGTVLTDERRSDTLVELRDVRLGRLYPVNLKLNAGEILGISGLPGSGLHEIAFAVSGHLAPESGEVLLARPDLRRALVPPHRESQGGFGELSVRENMALSALSRWRRFGSLLDPRTERNECKPILDGLEIKPRSLDTTYEFLSGGNKQKVIFGRALLSQPSVFVLCEPTRGVDVGTRSEIYRLIRQLAAEGAAVLVASSDAEDLFSVCERVALIVGSTLQPDHKTSELTPAALELMV